MSDSDVVPGNALQVLNVNVGVLGHVDSGKTSLVKALSTVLSTAALDKSKQSRQRGMTLDLGFSCFFLDMPTHLQQAFPNKTTLQMTLVDSPGHASLIRTIIGGAQIIDMMLLVVDAVKGWQAQTTECLVLAELTSPHLVVALNKADIFETQSRDRDLELASRKVRERLKDTRFADAPIIGVAACVGGEKVAAASDPTTTKSLDVSYKNETYNLDTLISTLRDKLPAPRRISSGPFYFSIDHCFSLKGRGTILTGTVLSGSASVNDVIEFPDLSLERKIKSMQMFKRNITTIQQGDRAGICVSNFDAKILERGVAVSPGVVQLWKGAIALVRKVPYYPGTITCGSKFHISVGHATIMATTTFWGARELLKIQDDFSKTLDSEREEKKTGQSRLKSSSLGGGADRAGIPSLHFNFDQAFWHQDDFLETVDGLKPETRDGFLHWALLEFQTPVHCSVNSLIIGSRLDTVDNASGSVSSCRLAFSGRLIQNVNPETDIQRIRLYAPKERRGVVSRLGDPHKRSCDGKVVRYEVFGSDLFKKETNMKLFAGMKVETEQGDIGEIKSSYGTAGKFRVFFPAGTEVKEGEALFLRFRRFVHDPEKKMFQDAVLPAARPGALMIVPKKTGKKSKLPDGIKRVGEVSVLKGDVLDNGKHNMAIIAGFFAPEVNIKERAGVRVLIPSTNEEGSIVGPFGKAGKCKVAFEQGISAEVGTKAELQF